MPEEMKAYIRFLERELNVKTVLVGLGPEREMTITTPAFDELIGSLTGVRAREPTVI